MGWIALMVSFLTMMNAQCCIHGEATLALHTKLRPADDVCPVQMTVLVGCVGSSDNSDVFSVLSST